MRQLGLLLPLVASLAASAGCGHSRALPAAAAAADASSEARAGFDRACASCHGTDGRGHGPVAPALRTAPADLTGLTVRNGGVFPRERVIAVVTGEQPVSAHGTREMPVWALRYEPTADGATAAAALVARRRLELLVDYVESLQAPPPAP